LTEIVSLKNAEHYTWGEVCDGWHLLNSDALSVIQERVPSGAAEIRHYHERSQQFFFVLAGEATLEIGGETVRLAPQQGVSVPAGVPHRLSNESGEELSFIVVSAPRSHGDRVVVD